MNPVIFMPRVMPHIGSGGCDSADCSTMLLTFAIVGVILIILGILGNILHVKFSQGFDASICWTNIRPDFDNSFLGCLCGTFGFILVCTAAFIGLIAGIYEFIITL